MIVISHRGALGLAPENTITGIMLAKKAKADFIEFDIHKTGDDQIVLSHDRNLSRMYDVDLVIGDHTLRDLKMLCPDLPTLDEALLACEGVGVIIDSKEYIKPELLMKVIQKYTKLDIRFASFNHHFIKKIKKHSPRFKCYTLEHLSPFEIISHAVKNKSDGIGLNYGLINHVNYFLAKRKNLDIYIYSTSKKNLLNYRFLANLINFFYPGVMICTDRPDKLKTNP